MPNAPARPTARIAFLDELRGLCVLLMVGHHATYTLGYLFDIAVMRKVFLWIEPVLSPLFASVFFVLCGISCRLSRSNLKRGLKLAGVAVGLSAVLYGFDWAADTFFDIQTNCMIWFGVLHMLACAILLYTLLHFLWRTFCRIIKKEHLHFPGWLGMALSALLFLLFSHWVRDGATYNGLNGGYFGIPGVFAWYWPKVWTECVWTYPLGIGLLYGADWYPIFPWVFAVFFGTGLGCYAARFPKWMTPQRVPALGWVGRHALLFSLGHQPVIFGLCAAVMWVIGLWH